MKLTPLDIHHKEFHRSIRGYNEEEVDLFLDQVYAEFERVFNENATYKEKVEQLESKLKQFEGIEQTLQNTLLTAQKSAEEVQTNAKKEADLILKDAEMKAKNVTEDAYNRRQELTNTLRNLSAIEEEFISRLSTTLHTFKERIDKAKKDQKEVEKRVEKEAKKLPEPEIKVEETHEKKNQAKDKTKQKESKQHEANNTDNDVLGEVNQSVEMGSSEQDNPQDESNNNEISDDQNIVTEEEPAVREVNVESVAAESPEAAENTNENQDEPQPVAATLASDEEVDNFMKQNESANSSSGLLNRIKAGFNKKDTEDNGSSKRRNTEEIDNT